MSSARNLIVLLTTTWAFTVCFAVWMMFGVTGIPIREQLGLNSVEFGLLTATPVLTGALFRLPLGIWTDQIGGRRLMLALLVVCAVSVWISSYATALWHFILLGLVGASFSVGTPYVARFFPKEKRGFAMGVFGAGTVGAALNMFVAPWLIDAYGWQMVPKVYVAALIVTAVIFWFLSAPDPARAANSPSMLSSFQCCATHACGNTASIIPSCSAPSWIDSASIRAASCCFCGIVWVSLILNYLTEVRRAPVMGENVMGEQILPSRASKA